MCVFVNLACYILLYLSCVLHSALRITQRLLGLVHMKEASLHRYTILSTGNMLHTTDQTTDSTTSFLVY